MPGFSTEVPHQLGQQEATERLKGFLEKVQEKYKDQVKNLEGDWNEHTLTFSFRTFGFSISGTLTVEEELAKLDGKLPFAAVAFRGKIQEGIREQLEKTLA